MEKFAFNSKSGVGDDPEFWKSRALPPVHIRPCLATSTDRAGPLRLRRRLILLDETQSLYNVNAADAPRLSYNDGSESLSLDGRKLFRH